MTTSQFQHPRFSIYLSLLAVVWFSGCGDGRPTRVPVSGQVLIDGQPLAAGVDGFIRVIPSEGRAATGRIDPTDGTFTLTTYEPDDGCLEGTHRVAIVVNANVGARLIPLIQEKYSEPDSSGLTVTIDGPTDALKIELQGPLLKAPAVNNAEQGDDPGPV